MTITILAQLESRLKKAAGWIPSSLSKNAASQEHNQEKRTKYVLSAEQFLLCSMSTNQNENPWQRNNGPAKLLHWFVMECSKFRYQTAFIQICNTKFPRNFPSPASIHISTPILTIHALSISHSSSVFYDAQLAQHVMYYLSTACDHYGKKLSLHPQFSTLCQTGYTVHLVGWLLM
jgi:hypothetical protein